MQRQRPGSTTQLRKKAALGPWYSRVILGVVLPLGIGIGIAQSQGQWEPRHTVPQQTVGQQRMIRVVQAEALRFNIPSQPLSPALRQFSQVTNLELSFDAALTEGLRTQGLSGTYTPEHALQQLLTGTGLRYRFTSPNAVMLERQGAQESGTEGEALRTEPILVRGEQATTGYKAERTTSATKTDTPLLDIPQSIQIIPRQVIEDQSVVRLRDAVRNVSGTTGADSSFSVFADEINIRGFDARENYVKNGLRRPAIGIGASLSHDTANIEQIEVIKGPASVLYGQLAPGGIINIVTKQPLAEPLYAGELTAGSYNFFRVAGDLSGPLNDKKTVLYRLNGAYEYSEAFLDFFDRNRFLIAPVVTMRLTPRTTLTLEGEYLQDRTPYYAGIPAVGTVLPNINGDIPLSRWPGDPPFDELERRSAEIGYRFEHRFNRHLLLRNAFRAVFFRRDDTSLIPLALRRDQRTLTRGLFVNEGEIEDYLLQTEVVVDFTTGSLIHTVLVGFELRHNNRTDDSLFDDSFPSIDLFNPTYFNTFSSDLPFDRFTSEANLAGVYVQDQITLWKYLKLLAGVRFDYVEQETRSTFGDTGETDRSSQDDTAFSPRVGIVYRPITPLAVYASFSRSFEPQTGITADGTPEPEEGTQYEVGIKGEFLEGRMLATLALYHLTKENILTEDPDDPRFSRAIGEQRSRGIELDIAGEILPGWSVIASYAFTDAEITEDFSGNEGNRPENVAQHSASLWSIYRFQYGTLQGLGFGAGIFYVGERQGDLENTFELPDYVRTDVTVLYEPRFLPNVKARLTVQNLFDVEYFEGSTGDVLVGAPVTVLGTIGMRF